jgi:conjugative transfer signal peptidase TraF
LASTGKIRAVAAGLLVALVLVFGGVAAGLRFNGTHSFPLGFYFASHKHAGIGDLVFVATPDLPVFAMAKERGYLDVAYSPTPHILKKLVAVSGDRVTITAAGVDVNGIRLVNSAPMNRDGAGRPLVPYPLKDYDLLPGEVLLMSDYNPASFDSRYFGPVRAMEIEAVVKPLLTWN